MKKMKNISMLMAILFLALFLNSCEDSDPGNYIAETYVEAYLIVGQPIEKIMVYKTLPTNVKYTKSSAMIKDANVIISVEGTEYPLVYTDNGYEYADKSVKVLPKKKYELKIVLNDNVDISKRTVITGETNTPDVFQWVREPKPIFHYPQDTLKLPRIDSLDLEWTSLPDNPFFLLRVTCIDTLEYGKYLTNPTTEMNRRAYNINNKINEETNYKNITSWAFIANTKTPTVWNAFKWFGKQEVAILCPDFNMINWFVNVHFTNSSYTTELLNSVKGANGVFGSASIIEKEFFLIKNQP